jgi:RHS repeat-associated protein
MKQEKIYTPHAQERALVKLIPWSFAGLIDPLSVFADKHTPTLYWSQSRVYSPTLREWLTVDPMVKMDPQSLVEMPGNWNAVEYASGDPVNLVDTSRHFAMFAPAVGGIVLGGLSGAIGGAATATLVIPLYDILQPRIERSQQSITAVMWHQLFFVGKWVVSKAHRSFGRLVRLRLILTLGLKPRRFLFLIHLLIFKIR